MARIQMMLAIIVRAERRRAEKSVRSPLIEVGLSKDEIRQLSKKHNLSTWDKPASPCLSSRIAYGVPVTIERLSKVERGEEYFAFDGIAENFASVFTKKLCDLKLRPTKWKKF